eukprot:g8288.t1
MTQSRDLFDESTMSFGEHLEALRVHLWKAIIGLVAAVILCLFFGSNVIAFVRGPIDSALKRYNYPSTENNGFADFDFAHWLKVKIGMEEETEPEKDPELEKKEEPADPNTIRVKIKAIDMHRGLKKVDPELVSKTKEPDDKTAFEIDVSAEEFAQLRKLVDKSNKTVALNVQEAFLTYLKVALIAGFVLASPWIFYQLWLFVAAGLYPHEKRYVHIFLPMSIGLFIGGALFCFYAVFPFVLKFLLAFNETLGVDPQIRLSEWISFAIVLPMMFGISFQLPLCLDNPPDNVVIDGLARLGPIQIDQMNALRAPVGPAPGHCHRVFTEYGFLSVISLPEPHALAAPHIDCRENFHRVSVC